MAQLRLAVLVLAPVICDFSRGVYQEVIKNVSTSSSSILLFRQAHLLRLKLLTQLNTERKRN